MKQIAKRALNLMPIWVLFVFLDWVYEKIKGEHSNDTLYIVLGILGVTLAINYVFFGVLTLWHRPTDEVNESEK